MYYHQLNPLIATIGPLQLHWYSLAYLAGFLGTYAWLHHLAKQQAIPNLTTELVDQYTLYAMLGVLLGGRIFEFIFYHPRLLVTEPIELLRIWHGGMSFHGGLIGVILVTWLFTKKHRITFLALSDALVIPTSLALALGRIMNFVNGELWGTLTEGNPWYCIDYTHNPYLSNSPRGCRYPSQLFEATKNLIIFTILVWQQRFRRRQEGFLSWLFITLYGLLRFIVTFWRDDPRIIFNLSEGQLLCILMIIIGIYGLYKTRRYQHLKKSNKRQHPRQKTKNHENHPKSSKRTLP